MPRIPLCCLVVVLIKLTNLTNISPFFICQVLTFRFEINLADRKKFKIYRILTAKQKTHFCFIM